MKVAYCVESIHNSGGIERVLSTKTNYFAEHSGYEVHIVVAGKKPDSLFFRFSDKIHFHYLNLSFSKQSIGGYLFTSQQDKIYKEKLEQVLSHIQPDITLSTFGREASFLYRIKDGSKKVLEFHFSKNYLKHLGEAISGDKYKILRKCWLNFLSWRENRIASKYRHIVLLTEKDKQLWGGDDKFRVIPNPLSFETDLSSKLENKEIVAMGRYMPQKGFDLLVRSFAEIRKDFPGWKLFIYGDGQDKLLLETLIKEFDLQEQVFLHPPVADVEKALLRSSIFVFPSRYEGFGLVLTEAMVCGVPCVATDCECGPSEIITDGEDGYLVVPDNIEAFAQKMRLLMENESLRKKMGEKAKENAYRFTIANIGGQWENYFIYLSKK